VQAPNALCAFNDRGRTADPSSTGLHFFRNDEALLPVIGRPIKYVPTFSSFRLVLTPDITIGDGMPPWQRARAVVISRMAGVVWQAHGLTVIPTLRWRTKDDYDNVASGIPAGSVVAVATYGSRRDDELRSEFERGLAVMVERMNPSAVLVFGTVEARVFTRLSRHTEFIAYAPPTASMTVPRTIRDLCGQETLFEVA
jgi:hypothetical protein